MAVERYCVPGGAGTKTGIGAFYGDFSNAWDMSQAMADGTLDMNINCAGAFSSSAAFTKVGNNGNFIGWLADLSSPSYTFSDMPSIDFAGLASGHAINMVHGTIFTFFEFLNAPAYTLYSPSFDGWGAVFCKFTDCEGVLLGDNYCFALFNKIDGASGSTAWLITADIGLRAIGNEITNCGNSVGIRFNGHAGVAMLNFIDGVSMTDVIACPSSGDGFVSIANTINGGTRGFQISGSCNAVLDVANIVSNATTAYSYAAAASGVLQYFNNLYNNTTDHDIAPDLAVGETALDPQYTGLPDYSIGESSLIDLALAGLQQQINVGAWQGGGGDGGGISNVGGLIL